MAKKSKIQNVLNIKKKVLLFKDVRNEIKTDIKKHRENPKKVFELYQKLDALPRMSSKVRLNTRCNITGRPKAVYKLFQLSRIHIRELSSFGLIPGIRKSSW